MQLHVVFDRVPVRRTTAEVRVYSGEKPDFMQIWKQEQGLDIARNATTGVDRVKAFTFQASGGRLAPLFDGTEKVLSIDAIPWYVRATYLP